MTCGLLDDGKKAFLFTTCQPLFKSFIDSNEKPTTCIMYICVDENKLAPGYTAL